MNTFLILLGDPRKIYRWSVIGIRVTIRANHQGLEFQVRLVRQFIIVGGMAIRAGDARSGVAEFAQNPALARAKALKLLGEVRELGVPLPPVSEWGDG